MDFTSKNSGGLKIRVIGQDVNASPFNNLNQKDKPAFADLNEKNKSFLNVREAKPRPNK